MNVNHHVQSSFQSASRGYSPSRTALYPAITVSRLAHQHSPRTLTSRTLLIFGELFPEGGNSRRKCHCTGEGCEAHCRKMGLRRSVSTSREGKKVYSTAELMESKFPLWNWATGGHIHILHLRDLWSIPCRPLNLAPHLWTSCSPSKNGGCTAK